MTNATADAVGSRKWTTVVSTLAIATAFCGCAGTTESSSTCLEALELDCTPAYEPSYDAIYDDLLSKTCGAASTGSVCHFGPTAREAQGQLALSDRDQAYDSLLGNTDGRVRVRPGEPECSSLVQRLESDDPAFRMPVGSAALSVAERCVVRQWIADGARR